MRRRPSGRALIAAAATLAIALVITGSAYAATILYFQGNLGFVQSSGVFANHTQHYVVEIDSTPFAYLQTGHENASGQHVAIARGWGAANWGPSGPAGWYGRPKCWRLDGQANPLVRCFRVTA